MKELIILGSANYPDSKESNYGDCIIINTGDKLFIYDCGSERHAETVIEYMDSNNFATAEFILSHNDDDHFKGLPLLIAEKKITKIYTVLLLKHVDAILDAIDDGRKSRESVKKDILDKYDNIAKLSGCNLCDIYDSSLHLLSNIHPNISIVGPSYDYMIHTVAKRLDGREGDTVDGETAVNATSVQLSVSIETHNLLLTGDSSFPAIEDNVRSHDIIQLPHHGKPKQAKFIFNKKWDQTDSVYLVSDNTGNSNGGSDELNTTGHHVFNTKSGNITINSSFFAKNQPIRTNKLG